MLTQDPAGHHPEVSLRADGVLGSHQQLENTLIMQHEPHEGLGDGYICRAKTDGPVVQPGVSGAQMSIAGKKRKSKIAPCAHIRCRW